MAGGVMTSAAVEALAGGIELDLVPAEVELMLRAEETGPRSERLQPMWHRVVRRPGTRVELRSRDDRLRRVRLSVRSAAPGWNPRWVRWAYAVRQTPDEWGGEALVAQDVLAADESTLILLVIPDERRACNLEFEPVLDGQTYPGDYPFEVVLSDVEENSFTRSADGGRPAESDHEDEVTTAPGLLRLRHPPAALMSYLPAIYWDEPEVSPDRFTPFEDRSFFERFLRGFEDSMEPLQVLLANLYRYFDPDSAPADFLPWLATWVALLLDDNWPMLKRRRLIGEAVELYRWRGTGRGLSRYLEIYASVVPRINDQPFTGMRLGADTLLGRDTILGDVRPHTFVVTLAVPDPQAINEQIVRDIIQAQKPAHTAYHLNIVPRAAGE